MIDLMAVPFDGIIIIIIFSLLCYCIIEKKITQNKELDDEQKKKRKKTIKKITILWTSIAIVLCLIFMVMILDDIRDGVVDKPIIYLYPEQEETITVRLGKKENLTCTYPIYDNKWEVTAKPNGELTDLSNGRSLYALYWEGIRSTNPEIEKGFCVKGEDTVKFLEEKLKILGLTDREADEFIIYWLPKLGNNKYNLIKFESMEEINENMPLEISPEPDTVIRVLMAYKPVNKYVDIEEQTLSTPERKGFTVVEWGGTEIENTDLK